MSDEDIQAATGQQGSPSAQGQQSEVGTSNQPGGIPAPQDREGGALAAQVPPGETTPRGGGTEIADGRVRPLDPRYLDLSRRRRFVASAILALAAFPVPLAVGVGSRSLMALGVALAAWLCAAALLAWQAWSWPPLAYRHASYVVTLEGLEIRRGVVFRSVVNVPRVRVQHTDVSQGPIERNFGLGRLVVFTAGSSFARVELPGLDYGTALRIRDFLLHQGGGDAV